MIEGLRPYEEMRSSGLPWLGEIPAHWDIRRAKRLLSPTAIPVRGGDEIVTCFRDGQVTLRRNRRAKGFMTALLEQGYQGVRSGQLVVHSMDAFAGAIGISDSDGKCTPEYIVCNPRDEETEPAYYAWVLRQAARTGYILASCSAVRERAPRLRYPNLAELRVPVPPRAEQKLIVRFLDWHGTQTAKLLRARQATLKLVAEQRIAMSEQLLTSSNLKPVRLSVFADLITRPVIREAAQSYVPVGLYNRGRGIFHKATTKGDELGDSTFQWIEQGDFVLSGQFAWEGAVALATPNETGCIASHRYYVLRAKQGVPQTAYLSAFFRTGLGHLLLNENSRGAAGRNKPLNIRSLMKEQIPVPPDDVLKELVPLIEQERLLADAIARFTASLKEFRTRLIADIVTGKLDVRAIAASLPEAIEPAIADEPDDAGLEEGEDGPEDEEAAA